MYKEIKEREGKGIGGLLWEGRGGVLVQLAYQALHKKGYCVIFIGYCDCYCDYREDYYLLLCY